MHQYSSPKYLKAQAGFDAEMKKLDEAYQILRAELTYRHVGGQGGGSLEQLLDNLKKAAYETCPPYRQEASTESQPEDNAEVPWFGSQAK